VGTARSVEAETKMGGPLMKSVSHIHAWWKSRVITEEGFTCGGGVLI